MAGRKAAENVPSDAECDRTELHDARADPEPEIDVVVSEPATDGEP